MCETTIVLMRGKEVALLRSVDDLILPTMLSTDYGSETLENTPNGFTDKVAVTCRRVGVTGAVSCFAKLEDVDSVLEAKGIAERAVWMDGEELLREALGLISKATTVTRESLDVIRLHYAETIAVLGELNDNNDNPNVQVEEVA